MVFVVLYVRGIYRDFIDLEKVREHHPSFQVEIMSGVGHFVMLEDPVTFNRLLEGIIQNVLGQ